MKQLVVTGELRSKLDRLSTAVDKLYFVGYNVNNLASKPIVSVVGTRKITPYGKIVTSEIVTELVRAGVVIVSGLAFGVDILAHKATLDAGGKTIAVLPTDTRHIYPASHRHIADEIIRQGGTLVSEHRVNPSPRAEHFLQRNRIIAALSDTIIIPEAAERSGSLNTANHARSMNIPVYAIPGRINDSQSGGVNKLIATGQAQALLDTATLLSDLSLDQGDRQSIHLSEDEQLIYSLLLSGFHDITEMHIETNAAPSQIQATLSMLEIAGLARLDSAGRWHRRSS